MHVWIHFFLPVILVALRPKTPGHSLSELLDTVGYFCTCKFFFLKPGFMFTFTVWGYYLQMIKSKKCFPFLHFTSLISLDEESQLMEMTSCSTQSLMWILHLSLFTDNQLLIRAHQPSLSSLNCIKCIWPFAMEICTCDKIMNKSSFFKKSHWLNPLTA